MANLIVVFVGVLFISLPLYDFFITNSAPWVHLINYFVKYWKNYPEPIIFQILMIICGIGLLKLRNWARLGIIIICWWVYVLHIPYYWFEKKHVMRLENFLGLMSVLLIIIILTRPKVKSRFSSDFD